MIKYSNFIFMIRMLKILVIILLSSLAVHSQIYIKPNNSYGLIQNRFRPDSTQLIPTFCGVPSGKASLHAIDQKMSALCYDSCGHKFYIYDPSDSSWTKLGAIQLNDSMFIVGKDTVTIRGTGGGGGINQLTGDIIAGPGIGSQATTIANNAVTNAKLRQSAGLSLIGRSGNSTGNVADITAGSSHTFLGYDGSSLSFHRPFAIIDAREYGCVGDNSTDNTSAFQALFDAVPSGSHIYIAAGKYKIFGTVTIKKANITIEGANGNLSYNYTNAAYDSSGTMLIGTSTTANMIVDSMPGISLIRLSVMNSTTPTAGTGVVLASAGHFVHIFQCRFYGFYNNLEIENGALWNITDCGFWNPINQNIYIHSPTAPDSGDWAITGCNFIGNSTGVTHIEYESSGGGKIIGCKFNDYNGAGGPLISKCINMNIGHSTSDLIISACSFENFHDKAISLDATDSFYNVQIHDCQFSSYNTIVNMIYATGKVGTISIRNNIFHDAGANTVYAIYLNNVGTTQIENNSWRGWTNKIFTGTATTVGGNSIYTSGSSSNDAKYFFGNSTAENFGVQNLNSSGFSGIDYLDNSGVPQVRTGWSNGSALFKTDIISSGGYSTFSVAGSEKLRINSTGVAIGASYYLPPSNGTSGYIMTSQGGSSVAWLPPAISGSGTSGRVAFWNGSSSLTSDANYLFSTSNNGTVSIGTTNTQGHFNLGGNKDLTATGMQTYLATATYTDQTTAASGTSSSFGINYIAGPAIAAANTSVTFPSIMTLLIDPPTEGTHATITDKWAIMTGANGNIRDQGTLRVDDKIYAVSAYYASVTNVSTNTTISTNVQLVKIDASSGSVTVTLPAASSAWNGTLNTGMVVKFIRMDSSGNTVTVSAGSGDSLNGVSTGTFTLTGQYSVKGITATGATAWLITQP